MTMRTPVQSLGSGQLFGRARRQETVCGAVLAETAYAPLAVLPPHCHPAPTLFLIVRGQFVERADGRSAAYPAGTFSYQPAGAVHGGRFAGGAGRGFHIELTHEVEAARGMGLGQRRLGAHAVAVVAALLRQLCAELRRPDDARRLALEGLVLQLLAALVRGSASEAPATREARAVRRAQELLAETGGRAPDWAALAAASGVPEDTLARAFRRTLGCTPAEYLRRVREESAARALAEGDAPLGRVALDAGYYDQAHFSRAFKARFGVTPSAYRTLARA
jgi:AraC-like DNA-binding protein/quercetin dioxygenase-like cupin family protein